MKRSSRGRRGDQDSGPNVLPPEKFGWIRKFCGRGMFRDLWRSRFMVLRGERLYISEKEVKDERKAQEVFDLADYERSEELRKAKSRSKKNHSRFTLLRCRRPGNTVPNLVFLAVSPEEKESWVNALNLAIIRAKNRILDQVSVEDDSVLLLHPTRDRVRIPHSRRLPTRGHLVAVASSSSRGVLTLDLVAEEDSWEEAELQRPSCGGRQRAGTDVAALRATPRETRSTTGSLPRGSELSWSRHGAKEAARVHKNPQVQVLQAQARTPQPGKRRESLPARSRCSSMDEVLSCRPVMIRSELRSALRGAPAGAESAVVGGACVGPLQSLIAQRMQRAEELLEEMRLQELQRSHAQRDRSPASPHLKNIHSPRLTHLRSDSAHSSRSSGSPRSRSSDSPRLRGRESPRCRAKKNRSKGADSPRASGSPHPRAPPTSSSGSPHPRAPPTSSSGSPHPRAPPTSSSGSPHPRAPPTSSSGSPHPRAPPTSSSGSPHPRAPPPSGSPLNKASPLPCSSSPSTSSRPQKSSESPRCVGADSSSQGGGSPRGGADSSSQGGGPPRGGADSSSQGGGSPQGSELGSPPSSPRHASFDSSPLEPSQRKEEEEEVGRRRAEAERLLEEAVSSWKEAQEVLQEVKELQSQTLRRQRRRTYQKMTSSAGATDTSTSPTSPEEEQEKQQQQEEEQEEEKQEEQQQEEEKEEEQQQEEEKEEEQQEHKEEEEEEEAT